MVNDFHKPTTHFTSGPCIPDKRLIVQIPDGDVTITAAAEADLGVRTDGQCIARCRRWRQLGFHTRRRLHNITQSLHHPSRTTQPSIPRL